MRLVIFGAVVAAAGLALGIDGLVYSGGFWIVTGLLIGSMLANRRREMESASSGLAIQNEREIGRIEGLGRRDRPGTWAGFGLTLAIGLVSLTIGIFEVGFTGENETFRWLPVGVGVLFTVFALISLPVRLGIVDPPSAENLNRATLTVEEPIGSDSDNDPKARLEKLEELRRSDLITPGEYEEQRQRILGSV